VRQLQQYLSDIARTYSAIPALTADGVFGSRTAEAVRAFQRLFGLEVTGSVGAATWQEIGDVYSDLTEGAKTSGAQYGGSIS
ncbi:MAG: peptidoglycan-binding protein, partial [Clostridia bacterium]|nr:peptidoglycan-binding protein [Clostridia bacterium]